MITTDDKLNTYDQISVELIPTEISEDLFIKTNNKTESIDILSATMSSECRHQFIKSKKLMFFD